MVRKIICREIQPGINSCKRTNKRYFSHSKTYLRRRSNKIELTYDGPTIYNVSGNVKIVASAKSDKELYVI
ncbi:hypothetical protein [Clostridium sp. YIM B02551]|uniref:hypothetical protein n=1 Tax=Clostridium sp. YIM B02551 TaxID=2910679 RepID=UPI001EEAE464|nr:hypothetical protein [Clostridium sp. YIM B02551]